MFRTQRALHLLTHSYRTRPASEVANVSLGLDSPTRFDSGGVTYKQRVTDRVLSKPLDAILAGANIAAGAQYRHESYTIRNGRSEEQTSELKPRMRTSYAACRL